MISTKLYFNFPVINKIWKLISLLKSERQIGIDKKSEKNKDKMDWVTKYFLELYSLWNEQVNFIRW